MDEGQMAKREERKTNTAMLHREISVNTQWECMCVSVYFYALSAHLEIMSNVTTMFIGLQVIYYFKFSKVMQIIIIIILHFILGYSGGQNVYTNKWQLFKIYHLYVLKLCLNGTILRMNNKIVRIRQYDPRVVRKLESFRQGLI